MMNQGKGFKSPSRYWPTSSLFERSSTRVTCMIINEILNPADDYNPDFELSWNLNKNSNPVEIKIQISNPAETLKLSLSQLTMSLLLSSRRFGVAIGKSTTCFYSQLWNVKNQIEKKNFLIKKSRGKLTSPVSWQEIQLFGNIASANQSNQVQLPKNDEYFYPQWFPV